MIRFVYISVCSCILFMGYFCVCLSPGGLWSVFTLGGVGSKAGTDQEHNPLPLSNQSLLLLLVLANLTDGPDWPNPYRQAITCFRNTQGDTQYLLILFHCTYVSVVYLHDMYQMAVM